MRCGRIFIVLTLAAWLLTAWRSPALAAETGDPPPGAATEQEEGRILVWKLGGQSWVDDKAVTLLSGVVVAEVERHRPGRVTSESDLHTLLRGEQTRQQCGEGDTSCMAEIGAALGAEQVVSGEVGQMGSYWVLTLRLINVRLAKTVARANRRIKGPVDDLMEAIPGAVGELFGARASAPALRPITPRQDRLMVGGWVTFSSGLALLTLAGVATWQAHEAAMDYKASGKNSAEERNTAWSATAITGYTLGGSLLVTGIVLWALAGNEKDGGAIAGLDGVGFMPDAHGGAALVIGGRW